MGNSCLCSRHSGLDISLFQSILRGAASIEACPQTTLPFLRSRWKMCRSPDGELMESWQDRSASGVRGCRIANRSLQDTYNSITTFRYCNDAPEFEQQVRSEEVKSRWQSHFTRRLKSPTCEHHLHAETPDPPKPSAVKICNISRRYLRTIRFSLAWRIAGHPQAPPRPASFPAWQKMSRVYFNAASSLHPSHTAASSRLSRSRRHSARQSTPFLSPWAPTPSSASSCETMR